MQKTLSTEEACRISFINSCATKSTESKKRTVRKQDLLSQGFGVEEFLALPTQQLPALCLQGDLRLRNNVAEHVHSPVSRHESSSLTLKDSPSSWVRPWSYTTDDIEVCRSAPESDFNLGGISHETQTVSLLADSQIRNVFDLNTAAVADFSNICENGGKRLHRHSICDSNPTRFDAEMSDCSVVGDGDARLTGDVVLYSSGSKGPADGKKSPNVDKLKAVEEYFIETVSTMYFFGPG